MVNPANASPYGKSKAITKNLPYLDYYWGYRAGGRPGGALVGSHREWLPTGAGPEA
jgi:hypothetical protein